MAKSTPLLTREQYLKQMLFTITTNPKKFMFYVTCNNPKYTEIYYHINKLYKKKTSFLKAKQIILESYTIEMLLNPLP